jgi:hypothetical protein
LQAVVEGVPGRARQLGPAHHQGGLPFALPAQRHRRPPRRHGRSESARPDFVNALLVVLAVARVAGELGAAAALAGGKDAGEVLDRLGEVLREHHEALRAVFQLPASFVRGAR